MKAPAFMHASWWREPQCLALFYSLGEGFIHWKVTAVLVCFEALRGLVYMPFWHSPYSSRSDIKGHVLVYVCIVPLLHAVIYEYPLRFLDFQFVTLQSWEDKLWELEKGMAFKPQVWHTLRSGLYMTHIWHFLSRWSCCRVTLEPPHDVSLSKTSLLNTPVCIQCYCVSCQFDSS